MNPRRVLMILAVAELLAMAPWFSASAVAPALTRLWQLSPGGKYADALGVWAMLVLRGRPEAMRLAGGKR